MKDAERAGEVLQRFADHLNDKRRPRPVVTHDEAADIMELLQGEVGKGTAGRDAEIVRRGHTLACHRGCSHCCRTIVVTAEAEAALVARWLNEPEQAERLQRFRDAYPRWRELVGDAADRAAAAG